MIRFDESLSRDLSDARSIPSTAAALLIRRAGLSINDVARVCCVSTSTVRNWMSGKHNPGQLSRMRLEYLAQVVSVIAGSLIVPRIREWLFAGNSRLQGRAPIELLPHLRGEVLEAARGMA